MTVELKDPVEDYKVISNAPAKYADIVRKAAKRTGFKKIMVSSKATDVFGRPIVGMVAIISYERKDHHAFWVEYARLKKEFDEEHAENE